MSTGNSVIPWATMESFRSRNNKGMVLLKSDMQVLQNIKKGFCLIAAVTQATSRGGEEDIYSEISSIMTGIIFTSNIF